MTHTKSLFVALLLFVTFTACASKPKPGKKPTTPVYTYFVFQKPDGTFGYDIFKDNRQIVCQEYKPGKTKCGFATYEDAKKVSLMVIHKLEVGLLGADIQEEELLLMNIQ